MRKSKERAAKAALFYPEEAFEQMPNALLVLDRDAGEVIYANTAAEVSLKLSRKLILGSTVTSLFGENGVYDMVQSSIGSDREIQRQDLMIGGGVLRPDHHDFFAHLVVANIQDTNMVLLEWFELDKQLKSEREERLISQVQANKDLMRNLAHEIKNPLGGIRGAAQLLDYELPDKSLKEYTRVIVKEVDRLQVLVDRLLAPHKKPTVLAPVNIHEVLERVRSVVLAEFPRGLKIQRNYDISLPEIVGDSEQLIQAILNIVHNAAQALRDKMQASGDAVIELQTRVTRSITIAKKRHKLGIDINIIDNGPGIPSAIIDSIFLPLVSASEGGSGLGLTLAQTFIQKHGGYIEVESRPGRTEFHIQIPYQFEQKKGSL